MTAYIVAYDLREQGQNYGCLKKKLESYPKHWHMQQSVWIIVSNDTHMQIRSHLQSCLDKNDKIFVGQLSGAAWYPVFGGNADQWLVDNI